MFDKRRFLVLFFVLVFVILLSACGGKATPRPTPTPTPVPTPTPRPTPTPTPRPIGRGIEVWFKYDTRGLPTFIDAWIRDHEKRTVKLNGLVELPVVYPYGVDLFAVEPKTVDELRLSGECYWRKTGQKADGTLQGEIWGSSCPKLVILPVHLNMKYCRLQQDLLCRRENLEVKISIYGDYMSFTTEKIFTDKDRTWVEQVIRYMGLNVDLPSSLHPGVNYLFVDTR